MSHSCTTTTVKNPAKIAVIGGGVAGSIITLRLAELGLDTTLIEQGPGLVNGPPICHLHAGGSFYREISDQQCLTLLRQSIDTLKAFPQCVNVRPTIIAIPKFDPGNPLGILPRLQTLQAQYAKLVASDVSNQVLGHPDNYYRVFDKTELKQLATREIPASPQCDEDWMIPVAKSLDWSKVQTPLVMVQEYGLSGFRFAAIATLASQQLPNCQVLLNSKVNAITATEANAWQIQIEDSKTRQQQNLNFDYVINACGFRSGEIDDMLDARRERLVEFKAAYVANWQHPGQWPEIMFHGQRGTPQGMAQLTPYPDGYFQLHGMTKAITLFEDGLASSCEQSAQPKLPEYLIEKIDQGWPQQVVAQRTIGNIEHVAQFIPDFKHAETAAKPLYGAQQIPGGDPSLRAADVSFEDNCYARAEIVKASSALSAADKILQQLKQHGLLNEAISEAQIAQHHFPVSANLSTDSVTELAVNIAEQRGYPGALAKQI